MTILHDAGVDQGGFGAAEGVSQQLPVLRKAAGFDTMILQDAGRGFYRTEVETEGEGKHSPTEESPSGPQILGASVALNWAWRNRRVGGCQNTAVHNLEIRFCKIPTRSNHMCGQR